MTKKENARKCRYCHFKENGDVPKNHKELFTFKSALKFGYERVDIEGGIYDTNALLVVYRMPVDYYDIGSLRINYCPMCGRKL